LGSLYRVRRTSLREISQPEPRDEEKMIWSNKKAPYREPERGLGQGESKRGRSGPIRGPEESMGSKGFVFQVRI
jgi:hypothetical protein